MSTNYNQLLKDLEIGSVYVKILICFLGCTFMLYPFLCYFTHFFRELSVYEQIFFHIRQFCPIPGSWTSILHYGTCQISCLFLYSHDIVNLCHCDMYFLYIYRWIFFSPLASLCIVLFLEYLFLIITGAIAAFKEKKISKNEIYY